MRWRSLCFATLLLLFVSTAGGMWWRWDHLAGLRGDLAARYDLSHGRMKLLWNGLEDREGPEVRRILWEVYGIQALPTFGCVVSTPQVAYLESYNHRTLSHAARLFGNGLLERVYEEARWNVAESTKLTDQQKARQGMLYDLALRRPSSQDLPILIPLNTAIAEVAVAKASGAR